MTQFVTKEALERMITLQKGYIDAKLTEKQNKFTVGKGLSLVDDVLSVTLDTALFKIVTELPAAPAADDANKMFLVLLTGAETGNTYAEYIYLGADKGWEKIGEWKPEIDLTPYLKTADLTGEVTNTGFSLSKGGDKFLEVAFGNPFTGSSEGNKLTLELANIIAPKASGFYKFQVDAQGRVIAVTDVTKEDIIGLGFSSTEAMTQAITAAIKVVDDKLTEEVKTRTENDATLAASIQALTGKVTTLEEVEANRSDLTVAETEELFNTVYGNTAEGAAEVE